MGPVAVATEARLAGVARGDVGGAVAEDVLAVVLQAARRGAQPACSGCWRCGRLQQQRQRRGGRRACPHAGCVMSRRRLGSNAALLTERRAFWQPEPGQIAKMNCRGRRDGTRPHATHRASSNTAPLDACTLDKTRAGWHNLTEDVDRSVALHTSSTRAPVL